MKGGKRKEEEDDHKKSARSRFEADGVLKYHFKEAEGHPGPDKDVQKIKRQRIIDENGRIYLREVRPKFPVLSRPLYVGLGGGVGRWFYEREGAKASTDLGLLLPSMRKVVRSGAFDTTMTIGGNGKELLKLLGGTILDKIKAFVPSTYKGKIQGKTLAGYRLGEVGHGADGWVFKWPVNKGQWEGERLIEKEWLCLEWSMIGVGGFDGVGGMEKFKVHPNGYLQVLLGWDEDWGAVWEVAHRLVYWCYEGVPEEGGGEVEKMVVMHTCHNKRCLCPAHLLEGTSKENKGGLHDRAIRDRAKNQKP